MTNVSIIVDSKLCDGCCECIGACSANNIFILLDPASGHPVPSVAASSCNDCGDCIRVCHKSVELQVPREASPRLLTV